MCQLDTQVTAIIIQRCRLGCRGVWAEMSHCLILFILIAALSENRGGSMTVHKTLPDANRHISCLWGDEGERIKFKCTNDKHCMKIM